MSRVGLAAKSGWGKSYNTQLWLEKNLPDQDFAAILDYKDEYRGLVRGVEPSSPETDLCRWYIAGPNEVDLSPTQWAAILEAGGRLVIPRYRIDGDDWRAVVGNVAAACRRLYEDHPKAKILLAIDEAHIAAPQKGKYPEATKKAATTGRGEGLSSLWVTQRLAELAETIAAQWDEQILGGFSSDADLGKISVDYPADVHDTRSRRAPPFPSEIQVDGENLPLRKFEDDAGNTVGSEWVRSNDSGLLERVNTGDATMHSRHYGSEGQQLTSPYE
ncbi:ATP-binding protein [Natronosalvus halobius]|uniref:ATP-binding protein n=1 Tax=Natronosalvus halobius TaxID=2953746 RepID=UPI00209FFDA5|nr:ATP-binding protein [Natronosalvus halobius]USZ73243.1 ATP-binding protein [Natronosalvus halobius]